MEEVKVFHSGERVWSSGHIRNNTFFGPYQGNIEKMASRILNIQEPAKQLQEDKTIDLHIETDEQIWLQVVPGALCKWDPTMEMIRGPDSEIYLRTTRDIMPREELRAWFSPSLERELGISKNDMDIKNNGVGQQCPTCDMINQRSFFTAQTLLHCETDEENREMHKEKYDELPCARNSSFSLTQSSSSLANSYRINSSSYEMDSNLHHDLNSAFRRLANNTCPPFEDPKIASLISSFSGPRQLKETSSETVADHHKNEFRKKFQGNEHYLRKHLYREGLNERSVKRFTLTKFSDKEQRFLTSITMQKPLKYEQLDRNFHSNSEVAKNEKRHQDNLQSRELDMMFGDGETFSQLERHRHIWNPFRVFSKDFTSTSAGGRRHTEMDLASSSESSLHREEQHMNVREHNFSDRDEDSHDANQRITCHDSVCTCSSKCKVRNESNTNGESEHCNEKTNISETEVNDSEDQINEKRNSDFRKSSSSDLHGEQASDVHRDCSALVENTEHPSMMPHFCLAAPRPWLFPNPSFLSSMTRRELAQYHDRTTTLSLASLSRYQHINPFTLAPYAIPTGPQSSPRASQGFTCDFCGKVYCRKYVLKIHMRTHTGFKPLKCKFCDKSFSDPSNMKKHVKLHDTENTVHKCKHCGRNFVRYRGLLNHIKSKHTEPLNIGMLI